jgi:hypothetical protein
MVREEPSLETLWLKDIRMMDKVQITVRRTTVPSSKTFRGEGCLRFDSLHKGWISCLKIFHGVPQSLQANAGIVPLKQASTTSFQHHSKFIFTVFLPFDAI